MDAQKTSETQKTLEGPQEPVQWGPPPFQSPYVPVLAHRAPSFRATVVCASAMVSLLGLKFQMLRLLQSGAGGRRA